MPVKKYTKLQIEKYNKKSIIEDMEIITKFGLMRLPTKVFLTTHGYVRKLFLECPQCLKKRWVKKFNLKKVKSPKCLKCVGSDKLIKHNKTRKLKYGKDNPLWKGGRIKNDNGYILITLHPDDPFISMTDKIKRMREHRYIMAKHLNRPLNKWEVVHHKNGIRDDNRIENLELIDSKVNHIAITKMQEHINMLEQKIASLEKELRRRPSASNYTQNKWVSSPNARIN